MRIGKDYFLAVAVSLTASQATAVFAVTPFTIVALPDTQNYVNNPSNAGLFTQQTQWIADEVTGINTRNIQFVTHLGDVVSNGNDLTQWTRADTSMSILDGVIEYGILPGNHDYASTGNKSTGTTNYVNNFGPARFAGQSWYGGADPSGNNSYQTFTAGGFDFIHLSLEWKPADNTPVRVPSPIDWAQSVLDANPNTPVILSTHENLDDSPPGRSAPGNDLWNQLVRSNDQIFMVLNGHNHGAGGSNDGEYHQVTFNDTGREVYEVLQDYQDYPNGGDGWLRLIEFDIDNNQVNFETYSPVLDQFQTETVAQVGQFASQFTFDIEFADRLVPKVIEPPVLPYTEVTFRQGVDSYTGTEDKEVRSTGDDTLNGQAPSITVDGDDGNPGAQPTQGLIRFNNLTLDPSPLLPDTEIDYATITLNVTNLGSGMAIYRMTQDWSESTTWNDLGGDGLTPGVETDVNPLTTVGGDDSNENVPVGQLNLDITSAARDWIQGGDNFGVGLVPFANGTNGIDFSTSESGSSPELTVRILDPGVFSAHFKQGVDGYSGTQDTTLREDEPDTDFGAGVSVEVGGVSDNHALLKFDGLFGSGAGQIPTDVGITILRAELEFLTTEAGDPVNLHEMLVDWDEDAATWNSLTEGLQADDVEVSSEITATFFGGSGSSIVDVTASLQSWVDNPSSNFGWALLSTGSNTLRFDTSEGFLPPMLRVYYRLAGDLNGDGYVGIADLNIVLSAWNQTVPPADPSADLSGDGLVGIDDLNVILNNWNAGGVPPGHATPIPEPGTLALMSIAVMSCLARSERAPASSPLSQAVSIN